MKILCIIKKKSIILHLVCPVCGEAMHEYEYGL